MSLAMLALFLLQSPDAPSAPIELDQPAVCQVEQDALGAISTKYDAEAQELSREGDALESKHAEGNHVDFDVTFKLQRYDFDVPEVTMTPKRMVVKIPEVTNKTRRMVFSAPETRMVDKVVGRYPTGRVTCHGFPPQCTAETRPIIISVPEVRMVPHDMSTSVPEVSMRNRDIITNSPDIRMKTVSWTTKIPELKMKSPIPTEGPPPEVKREGDELQAKGAALSERISADLADGTAKLYDCIRGDLVAKRATAALQFDIAINQLTATVNTLQTAGVDASASVDDQGKTINYISLRDDLIKERESALSQIDEAIRKAGAGAEKKLNKAMDS